MNAYPSAPARGRRRTRSARSGAIHVFVLTLLLLFILGLLLGVRIGRSGRIASLFGRATELFSFSEPRSNIPDSIDLPPYISEELLTVNPYSRPGEQLVRVNAVVIHYVGNPGTSAEQNRAYFQGLANSGATSASSNLIVGLEGETLLCVPLDEVAYCSNNRNSDTISIEFCHPDETGEPTEETYEALVRLTAWLCGLYGLDPETDIIRHYDVSGKECPLFYVRNEDSWMRFKQDVSAAME